jgi:hypothetical protein
MMMPDQAKSDRLTIGDLRAAVAQIAEERRNSGELYKSPPVTAQSPGVALERGLQKLEKLSKG